MFKVAILATALVLFLGYQIAANEYFSEFRLKAQKYAHVNVPQNNGVHQLSLKLIAKLTSYYSFPILPLNKDSLEGVGASINETLNVSDNVIHVTSTKALYDAFESVKSGQIILISPGRYSINRRHVVLSESGTNERPIVLAASRLGSVTLIMDSREGFALFGKHWVIQNLIFRGVENKDSKIEHAIHIAGDADSIRVYNNKFINFNAHIKVNGMPDESGRFHFPDRLNIVNNDFYNEWKRKTTSPASPLDIVGGDDIVIKNNFIADFGKYGRKGYGVTYGAFMKGAGKRGLFENNVIACEWKVPHTSPMDVRIGLSFGNGGTHPKFCADGKCDYEHVGGEIRKNTILNCINDVGIYINKSINTLIEHNAIRSSLGIDIRYPQSSATIRSNIIDGRVKSRDGGVVLLEDNSFE